MPKVTKEEVLKIAAMSHLDIEDGKLDALIQQLEDVLSYAERVQEIQADAGEFVNKRVNVFREDRVIPSDSERVMQQAPEREGNYFVVPKILDGTR